MAEETLIFDAAGSNINGTDPGSPLTVHPGTSGYRLFECAYPAPPQNVQYASSVDTEGDIPVSSRYGNRTITLKFKLVESAGTLLAALQAKYAKLQREGGTLKRTMKNGDVRIYDILAGDGWDPTYDFAYYIANLTIVEMVLPARPFSRGAEVDLGDNVETTASWLTFTEASLAGDVAGLGRLVVDNDEATDQASFIWGLRSRYYDSASTAALFYQAESCALYGGSGSVATTRTGATGTGNTVVAHTTLSSIVGTPLFYIGASSTAQTHKGQYRLLARAQSPAANVGIVSLQAVWAPNGSAATAVSTIYNDAVPMADLASDVWEVLDLGLIGPQATPRGTQGWIGLVQALTTSGNDDVYVDWVALVPVLEGYGVVYAPIKATTGGVEVAHDGAHVTLGGYLGDPTKYEGRYMLVPPSGAEGRTVEVICKFFRYPFGDPASVALSDVPDNISAHLYYTPRYLT